MWREAWMRRAGWLLGVSMVLTGPGLALAGGPPEPAVPGDAHVLFPNPGDGQLGVFFGQPEPIKLSDYWLGLECRPVPPSLRAQLGLSEDEGLLVEQVLPDSPAAKAGIEQYDVLLKADGKPLSKIQDLIAAVDAAKEKELSLERVHGGKRAKITVKPAKRPESQGAPPYLKSPDVSNWWRKYLEQIHPGEGVMPPMRFRFWGPGAILPPDAKAHPSLPGNMSVTITRSGDEPAKIVVKRGDEKWEVTEDELDELPDDVRGHVQRALGRIATHRPHKPQPPQGKVRSYDFDLVPDWNWQMPHLQPRPEGPVDKRLEEMSRRIEELRKSIDELREKRPRLKDKDARPPKGEKPDKKPDRV